MVHADRIPLERHALLISGGEQWFYDYSKRYAAYLCGTAGFSPYNIVQHRCHPQITTNESVPLAIREFYKCLQQSPAAFSLIVYNGHGLKGGIKPTANAFVSYDTIAAEIDHDGPLLIVNDSCFSGSMMSAFRHFKHFNGCELISACSPYEHSYGDEFIEVFLASLEQSRFFNKRVVGKDDIQKVYSAAKRKPNGTYRQPTGRRIVRQRKQHPMKVGSGLEHLLFPKGQISRQMSQAERTPIEHRYLPGDPMNKPILDASDHSLRDLWSLRILYSNSKK